MPNHSFEDFLKDGSENDQSGNNESKSPQAEEQTPEPQGPSASLASLGLVGHLTSGSNSVRLKGSTFTISVDGNSFELQNTGPKQKDIEWLQSCTITSASDIARFRSLINSLKQTDPVSGKLKDGKKMKKLQHFWSTAVQSMDRGFLNAQTEWLAVEENLESFLACGVS